jgi:arylsulfatase A-like enzyme
MTRLLAGLLLLVVSPLCAAEARPNILWLIAEDFSPDLGCYGAKQVSTPNIDRLAREGVRYTRAFTTAPVCSASRSAFITGMYQTTIGAHHHRSHRDDGYKLPDGVRVISDWMRGAGYFTANVRQLPAACGFNGTGKTDWNFTYEGKPFDSDRWDELKPHVPFYAQVNFNETHRVNSRVTGRPWNSPEHADPEKIDVPPIYPDHPVTRRDWAGYLDAATALDRKVGAILKQLEDDGLSENTVVIFMADHGQAHVRGKQFCYDDGLRVPLIIRWPEKLARPKQFDPGTVSDQLISSLDITATTLVIAGVPKPPKMQGRVFLGDSAEPPREFVFGARDRCDETTFRFRTVRDSRFRYIRNFLPERPFFQPNEYKQAQYPVWNLIQELGKAGKLTEWQHNFYLSPTMPKEEFYDLDADPWAMNNLVASNQAEHQAALKRLRSELEKWLIESDDQGRFSEPPAVAAAKGATKTGTNPNSGASPTRTPPKKPQRGGSKKTTVGEPGT